MRAPGTVHVLLRSRLRPIGLSEAKLARQSMVADGLANDNPEGLTLSNLISSDVSDCSRAKSLPRPLISAWGSVTPAMELESTGSKKDTDFGAGLAWRARVSTLAS